MTTTLTTETVPIEDIRPDLKNARAHDERNTSAVAASLRRFGQQKPIVVDREGKIIAGNCTHAAALAIGWTEITIIRTDLAGTEATAYAIADNRTAELATWDNASLAALLDSLRAEDATLLDAAGFTPGELDALLDEQDAGLPDGIDDAALALGEAQTKPGDLVILGDHRLLCGDAADSAHVARLLDGQVIHLVNTDPPYNVKVEPRSNNAIAAGKSSFGLKHHQKFDEARIGHRKATGQMRPKDRPLENDFMSDAEFDRLLRSWFGNIAKALEPGRTFYIWGGYANCANYPPALAESELYFSQSIIWVKAHPVLTRKDFMGNHEWCFYGWRKGAAHWFNPRLRNIPDVWEVSHATADGPLAPGPEAEKVRAWATARATDETKMAVEITLAGVGQLSLERKRKHRAPDVWKVKKITPVKMVHLTEKPAELAGRAMKYSSRRGENVLDLFGGSGSTMAAAEALARRAYTMEIDPHYCDVIVNRWEQLTGGKAQRP